MLRTNERVREINKSIRSSMLRQKHGGPGAGSVLSLPGADGEPLIVRNALAVKMKLSTVPIAIWPGQLIPGSIALPGSDVLLCGSLPEYATPNEVAAAAARGIGVGSIVGHIAPSYPKLLKKGASGIKRDAERYIQTLQSEGAGGVAGAGGARGAEGSESRKSTAGAARAGDAEGSIAFYRACAIVMEALELFAHRHAALCEELAAGEAGEVDAERCAELARMAADLRVAPGGPPETFTQAVTAIWLTHLAFQLTGNHLAIGRFDQHVYPYLEADLANGTITMDEAQEIVDCFFLKFNERSVDNSIPYQNTDFDKARERNEAKWAERTPFDHSTQRVNARDNVDATNHWLQNVIIGGTKPDGGDAVNAVTYMCLDAFDKNRMTNPCLTVRLSSGSPDEIYKKSCETLLNGGGLPAFFNDDAIIPALVKWGIAIEDARDYTNDGCWEIIIAGQNDFYFDRFNMLRCLEWALNRGKSRVDGKQEAPDPGDAAAFATYDKVYGTFLDELFFELDGLMAKNHREFGSRYGIAPVPLLSALLAGPMELGDDMTRAGAKYVTYGLIAEGVSHVIDSLAAIKKVIFEDGAATMAELIMALDDNFEGHDALRAKLLAAPKYGRNDKYADDIGKDVFDMFAEKVAELNKKYTNMIFLPGAGTFSWYIAIGEGCGPSPDGRLANEAVSSNLSPSTGAATRGVTGSILSHAAFDMGNLPVGSPTDLRLSSKHVEGEAGMARLISIVKSFVSLGGNMLTLTIADTGLLRKAQAEPENYRDLRVRMGGWSAYFTMLSKEQQEHHIKKEEEV
ncbi:MAG: hypothetical protein FWH01_02290 [Oscillospiraceae bacterium]|nr:hypothetical protein [Oscillospiraceae bacterium]